jgi:hypothetical protein
VSYPYIRYNNHKSNLFKYLNITKRKNMTMVERKMMDNALNKRYRLGAKSKDEEGI